jgi:hypothetical protein
MTGRGLLRAAGAALGVAGISLTFLVMSAAPASAHGVGGLQPTDYVTRVDGIRPPTPGITVKAVDLDNSIELTNDTTHEVVVLGYQREPYLRIGPAGTFENTRSPAVFLNRTRIPTRAAPHGQYDARATPRWKKISDAPHAIWHDHRTHWMGTSDPAIVQRDPGRSHVVIPGWTVPLVYQGHRIVVTGDALYVPGPSPWPWVIGAVALATLVVALCRTRRWVGAMQAALAVLIVSETVHIVGAWQASTSSVGSRALSSIYSIGGVVVCVLALLWLRRRDPWAATPAVLVAGLFVFIAGGLADLTSLTRSQIPTSLPDSLGRLTVTIALGLGLGLVIAAGSRLRAPQPARPAGPPAAQPTLVH